MQPARRRSRGITPYDRLVSRTRRNARYTIDYSNCAAFIPLLVVQNLKMTEWTSVYVDPSYLIDTGRLFPRGIAAGEWSRTQSPTSAEAQSASCMIRCLPGSTFFTIHLEFFLLRFRDRIIFFCNFMKGFIIKAPWWWGQQAPLKRIPDYTALQSIRRVVGAIRFSVLFCVIKWKRSWLLVVCMRFVYCKFGLHVQLILTPWFSLSQQWKTWITLAVENARLLSVASGTNVFLHALCSRICTKCRPSYVQIDTGLIFVDLLLGYLPQVFERTLRLKYVGSDLVGIDTFWCFLQWICLLFLWR